MIPLKTITTERIEQMQRDAEAKIREADEAERMAAREEEEGDERGSTADMHTEGEDKGEKRTDVWSAND